MDIKNQVSIGRSEKKEKVQYTCRRIPDAAELGYKSKKRTVASHVSGSERSVLTINLHGRELRAQPVHPASPWRSSVYRTSPRSSLRASATSPRLVITQVIYTRPSI